MSSMNDCRPWTQKSAPGIFCGQAEDARSMLLFATGFKRPRADKKTQGCRAALFVAYYREGASGKSFDTPLTGGRWAYWHLGVWRTGGHMPHGRAYGARRRAAASVWAAHRRTGARAARIRRRAYRRVSSAPTDSRPMRRKLLRPPEGVFCRPQAGS